jgi:uncharacterized protein
VRVPRDAEDKIGRLNRDKVNHLAHRVTDALAAMKQVHFLHEHNSVRLEIRRLLEELLKAEANLDRRAREKIENQKRTILEGSQEWDILYRKYYAEELKKLGI